MRDDVDVGIEIADALARGLDLRAADVGRAVEDLAMEVREIDVVEVDEADPADARRGEIRRDGAAEASGADNEDGGGAEPVLPFESDLGERDLPGVASQGRSRDTIS
jgi:hypothetical protein